MLCVCVCVYSVVFCLLMFLLQACGWSLHGHSSASDMSDDDETAADAQTAGRLSVVSFAAVVSDLSCYLKWITYVVAEWMLCVDDHLICSPALGLLSFTVVQQVVVCRCWSTHLEQPDAIRDSSLLFLIFRKLFV